MPQSSIKFRLFGQVRQGMDRRLGILTGTSDLNVTDGIKTLSANQKRELKVNLERWLDGQNGPKTRFHNFEGDSIAPMAFVFKASEHRFYGYKVNPLPRTAPSLQAIVLCSHAIKPGYETDPDQKRLIKKMAESSDAASALKSVFDDTPKETKKGLLQWKQ
ncbi:MAG: hypothetical protein ACLPH3_23645 [Terracidiphilus sp.]